MKNSISFLAAILAIVGVSSCSKNIEVSDLEKYEILLKTDYEQAQKHINTNTKMYDSGDSSFSQHYYEFCIDLMKNGNMMGSGSGMMGSGRGMMGNNSTNTMGHMTDLNKMIAYMDSIHLSSKNINGCSYYQTDSLLRNQLIRCNMITTEINNIEGIFIDMQSLRKNRKQ